VPVAVQDDGILAELAVAADLHQRVRRDGGPIVQENPVADPDPTALVGRELDRDEGANQERPVADFDSAGSDRPAVAIEAGARSERTTTPKLETRAGDGQGGRERLPRVSQHLVERRPMRTGRILRLHGRV
jgi:hypothetical protein